MIIVVMIREVVNAESGRQLFKFNIIIMIIMDTIFPTRCLVNIHVRGAIYWMSDWRDRRAQMSAVQLYLNLFIFIPLLILELLLIKLEL